MAIDFSNLKIPMYKPDFSGIADFMQNRSEQEGRMRENALKAIQQQFLPEEHKAKLGLMGAQTKEAEQKARQMQALIDYLGGQQGDSQEVRDGAQPSTPGLAQAPASTPGDFKGVPFRMDEPGVNEGQPMSDTGGQYTPSREHATSVMSDELKKGQDRYQKEAKMSALTGGRVPLPQLKDIDGTTYAMGTQGMYPVAQGQTPGQKSRSEAIGKADADFLKGTSEKLQGVSDQKDTLGRMREKVEGYAGAPEVIGPVNKWKSLITGTPEDREFLGAISTEAGNITLDAAKSIKGAFTGRDMNLINSIKPNLSDNYDVFVGKLKAMELADEVIMRKGEIISREIRNGRSPEEAMRFAQDKVSMGDLRKQMDKVYSFQGKGRGDVQTRAADKLRSQAAGLLNLDGNKYKLENGQWHQVHG